MYETIIVDGTDLADLVTCITSLDGIYAATSARGDNIVFPGVDGETWVDRPYATGQAELGLTLAGSTTAEFNDAYRALRRLIMPGKKLALQRRMSFTTGDETHDASGEYNGGLTPSLAFMRFGRLTLSLKLHDGVWHGATVTVSTASPINVAGEAVTHRMTVTMPAGGALTNTTTGHVLSNTLTGADVVVDVEALVATQSGVDVSNFISFNGRLPMRLVPGVNTFTGSTSTIAYKPAYF